MKIKKERFGMYGNQEIILFTQTNDNGMKVSVMNYGATITRISVPDKMGKSENIVCGFDKLIDYFSEEYISNAPYFGNTPGRYTGRIKNGNFYINNNQYQLAINDGANHLHGGITGFDKKVWHANSYQNENIVGVKMTLESADGDEGYPGNVQVCVDFSLDNDNNLTIKYRGKTNSPTPLSLTNHSYFNLSAFEFDIDETIVKINANEYLEVDETNVPTGKRQPVNQTPANFKKPVLLKNALTNTVNGFEHYFLLEGKLGKLKKAAEFKSYSSNRKLTIYTTEPGALFYTGNYMSNKLRRSDKEIYGRYRGFCFETSRYPNGPNIPDAPGSILDPKEVYASTTIYKFSN